MHLRAEIRSPGLGITLGVVHGFFQVWQVSKSQIISILKP